MIEKIDDMPAGTIGFRASGKPGSPLERLASGRVVDLYGVAGAQRGHGRWRSDHGCRSPRWPLSALAVSRSRPLDEPIATHHRGGPVEQDEGTLWQFGPGQLMNAPAVSPAHDSLAVQLPVDLLRRRRG